MKLDNCDHCGRPWVEHGKKYEQDGAVRRICPSQGGLAFVTFHPASEEPPKPGEYLFGYIGPGGGKYRALSQWDGVDWQRAVAIFNLQWWAEIPTPPVGICSVSDAPAH